MRPAEIKTPENLWLSGVASREIGKAQKAPSSTAPTNINTAHTAMTSHFKASVMERPPLVGVSEG
jgi:hypothetical protein